MNESKWGKWLDPLVTAWIGVATHKLRSFLTMLGIVIGVAAVITLMSVGRGAQEMILSNIESMGSDLITISPGGVFMSGGVRGAVGGAQTLTEEDAEAIAEEVSNVACVAPYSSSRLQIIYGEENTNSSVIGVTTDYQDVYNLEIASGSFFGQQAYQDGARVALLGSEVKETLFGTGDPVGQQIRMGSIIMRVIGVLESKGGMMNSTDDAVLIPLTTMRQTVSQSRTAQGGHVVSAIALSVADEAKADAVVTDITSLLRTRHQLAADEGDDFYIASMEELVETLSEATGTLTLLLGAIAAISLLVGGIGVMNIMLVSVLERTREIGIRKALGAQERDIWTQFLLEAAFLTLAGGIIGVILGLSLIHI